MATSTTLLSNGSPFSQRPNILLPYTVSFIRPPLKLISLCSPSSSPNSITEQQFPLPDAQQLTSPNTNVSFSGEGCKGCGREEVENGCNGEGRIQGGIATFPGFGWWPIKAYRPCPAFVASGGRYERQGQTMDEVAFGNDERQISLISDAQTKSKSSKKRGPKKLKT